MLKDITICNVKFLSWFFEPAYGNNATLRKSCSSLKVFLDGMVAELNKANSKLAGKSSFRQQDVELTLMLRKLVEIFEYEKGLKVRFLTIMREYENFERSNESVLDEQRMKMIEFSIKIIMLCHQATLCCTKYETFNEKCRAIKKSDYEYFKKEKNLNKFVVCYLKVISKIPNMMRSKRYFNEFSDNIST